MQIRFNNSDPIAKEFKKVLDQRVNDYFKEKGISKKGNFQLYIKTMILGISYVGAFLFLIMYEPQQLSALLVIILMGLSAAGIGLNVMHDANHGAYSSHKIVNDIVSYSANFIGICSINWRIQHNIKHHTNTNIEEHDEDIAPKAFIRFTPHSKLLKIHRVQFIYTWVLYGLGTFFSVTMKDFVKFKKYVKEGLMQKYSLGVGIEFIILIITKVIYFSVIIAIPVYFTAYSSLEIVTGFMILHVFSGLGLAVIFQPSHLLEEVEYPLPDENGNMKYSWFVHQLYTSVNFANKNKLVTWYAGGLNFQIEHHLYPSICHIHYKDLSSLVCATASEYGYPYHSRKSFWGTLWAHTMMLKKLGSSHAIN